eukprot:scaffold415_cov362-Prasinococcus_capsulatus_cf.AAC.13
MQRSRRWAGSPTVSEDYGLQAEVGGKMARVAGYRRASSRRTVRPRPRRWCTSLPRPLAARSVRRRAVPAPARFPAGSVVLRVTVTVAAVEGNEPANLDAHGDVAALDNVGHGRESGFGV